jgi:2-aminoadipate transaminase
MNPSHLTDTPWALSRRAERMNPSVLRELLKLTEKPGVISLAGGLPSPKAFPVAEFEAASARVLRDDATGALQYAASEGYGPLREWVAASLPWKVDPAQVLITTGSQQGLDLAGKVLIDAGSRVLVESPTYLGALQAFAPMEPEVCEVPDDAGTDADDVGMDLHALRRLHAEQLPARFLYVLPNFQNPSGRLMSEARRAALSNTAREIGLPLIEDNPYGELWCDAPPPLPLAARHPQGCLYLGSFSKVLAPSLRLGFLVAPPALFPKLLQAKQAADLHSPGFNQRVAYEVVRDGLLDTHLPQVRALYRTQRDAMLDALARHMSSTVRWNRPAGGMFIWLRLPTGMDSAALLPQAVARGVAYVPGAAFYAGKADAATLRLSFVTASASDIDRAIATLATLIQEQSR